MTTLTDLAVDSLTVAGLPVEPDGSIDLSSTLDVTGAVTLDSTLTVAGVITGGWKLPTVTAIDGGAGAGQKVVNPALFNVSLTKGSAGTDYTLAVPGAANVGHLLYVYSPGAYAHVVTVTGLAGGTTLTFSQAAGNGFLLYAATAAIWNLVSATGITQS